VCDLYSVYTAVTGSTESLDHFYGWGQLIISDFDDLDKNMAVAHDVFRNLSDIHELDDVSYLDEEQTALLQHFFSNFSAEHNSELKRRFLQLWSRFEDIYNMYRKRLRTENLAYEGMLYRDVAEQEEVNLPYDVCLFVGFNMMQQAEQRFCQRLMKEGRARFYWDFDHHFMQPGQEAGHYIRELLRQFPNELDADDDSVYRCYAGKKDVSFVSAPTEHVQARFAGQWLQLNNRIRDGRRTVIVMADEHLLPSVVRCLPDNVDRVNITTGYPLSDMPLSSLVVLLSQLRQGDKAPRYMERRVKRHPLAVHIDANLLHRPVDDNLQFLRWIQDIVRNIAMQTKDANDPLQAEAFFRMYTLLNRLAMLTEDGTLQVNRQTLGRLLVQVIRSTTIPFHGEPAVGLQVMGVLETRNLDFDHVLLLSCNEGNMPRGITDASFIPYAIRKAYGLTTADNKVAIFAYYFYSLLQRAGDVTICYNNATTDGRKGEMSRFMLQLMVEGKHAIRRQTLVTENAAGLLMPVERPKDDRVMERLEAYNPISPSALNLYLRCPLRFYYRHVMEIAEPDDNEDNEIDNRIFGNIFHRAAQLMYQNMGNRITRDLIEDALKHRERIVRNVDEAINEELFNLKQKPDMAKDLNGLQLINREVIIRYLVQLLEIDLRLVPFTIIGTEEKVSRTLRFKAGDKVVQKEIGGIIDRLDRIVDPSDGTERLRVVDYKTGGRKNDSRVDGVDDIFVPANVSKKHADYYLQTMLYSTIVRRNADYNPSRLPVSPALLFIQHAGAADYDPVLKIGNQKVGDIADYEADFDEQLGLLLGEIYNPELTFKRTDDPKRCDSCPYRQLCTL